MVSSLQCDVSAICALAEERNAYRECSSVHDGQYECPVTGKPLTGGEKPVGLETARSPVQNINLLGGCKKEKKDLFVRFG
jgi:hypothetical protein